MKKLLLLLIVSTLFTACAVTRKIENESVKLKFLDEYVLPADLQFQNTSVGGLSGIDYQEGKYYLICDQSSNPRFYTANIQISDNKFKKIEIDGLIKIQKTEKYSSDFLDPEAIRYDSKRDEIVITSEGLIDENQDPGIYVLSPEGTIQSKFDIPQYFDTDGEQKPRNNGVFEGLSESYDHRGYWVATELPLEKDGTKPKLYPTHSHVRITKFDKNTGEPMQQFAYKLEGISKLPINFFAVNGVTEILEYAPDKFLILERAYSAGYGSNGNTVKIFQVDISKASNTLDFENLKKADYSLPKKHLLFNFKSIKDQLTDGIIDNIEGMCFGPKLANGGQSLILVSDNNFNSFARQLNQFFLFEINIKE